MSQYRSPSRRVRLLNRLIPGVADIRLDTVKRARAAFQPALKGQKRRMWGAVGLSAGATLGQLLQPWPLQVVLDQVLAPAAAGTIGSRHGLILVGAGLAAALIPFVSAKLTYHATVVAAEIGKTATLRIRRTLFDHINRLSLDFHTESRTGDLLVRLTGDVNLLRDMLFNSWLNLLTRGLYFGGLTIALFAVDWRLGALALVPLPFLSRSVLRSSSELRKVVKSQRRREGSAAAFAGESLSQIRIVKAYSAEEAIGDRFAGDARRSERAGVKAARIAAGMALSTQRVAAIGGALVLFGGSLLVITGDLTVGVLLVAVSYGRSLYKPLRKMSNEAVRLSKASAVAERIMDILDRSPEPAGLGLRIEDRLEGRVTATGLAYRYPGGSQVFDGIDFDLAPGSLAVLTGPNGAGKSTLLSLLLRFALPDRGELRVDGRRVDHYRLHDYRSRIAYVPQSVLLFSGTLLENILIGNPGATDADLARAVELAAMGPLIDRLVDGLDTHIGERGETLSGGEARRVMLARAAVRDADLLLLDEPWEGIDAPSRPLIAASIKAIAKGRTTIVVSHQAVRGLQPDVVLVLDGNGVQSLARANQ